MKEYINKNEIFKKLVNFLIKGNTIEGTTKIQIQVLQCLSNYIKISKENVNELLEDEDKIKQE